MKLFYAKLSKAGGREQNEDWLGVRLLEDGLGCWVVADGLGGHRGGETASRVAVETILDEFGKQPSLSSTALRHWVESAHQAILQRQQEIPTESNMRTAIAVFCSDGTIAQWAHVGDVRVYAFRDSAVSFQSKDHSVPQSLANAGEIAIHEIRGHEDRSKLLRSLGSPDKFEPSVLETPFVILRGDIFLVCTDGFWDYVSELEMLLDWCKSLNLRDWLNRMELRLRLAAPKDHDNYSAIALLAEIDGD